METEAKHIWVVKWVDEDSSGIWALCENEEVAKAIRDNAERDDKAEYGEFDPRYWFYVDKLPLTTTLDPKPWVYALLGEAKEGYTPAREAEQVTGGFVFQPREGFIQDRKAYA